MNDTPVTIAASTLTALHDCTLAGITARCGGSCCTNPRYWPPMSTEAGRAGLGCAQLTPTGCRWAPDERPVTCNLYPLRWSPSGRGLVLHHVTRFPNSVCHGNYGTGPMLVDALRAGLVAVFGVDQREWARSEALAGRDVVLWLSPAMRATIVDEAAAEAANLPPTRRQLPVLS